MTQISVLQFFVGLYVWRMHAVFEPAWIHSTSSQQFRDMSIELIASKCGWLFVCVSPCDKLVTCPDCFHPKIALGQAPVTLNIWVEDMQRVDGSKKVTKKILIKFIVKSN